VSPNGCALTSVPKRVNLPAGTNVASYDILRDGAGFVLAYTDLAVRVGALKSVRLDAQGGTVGTPTFLSDGQSRSIHPSIVKVNGGFMVAWEESIEDRGPEMDSGAYSLRVGMTDPNAVALGGSLVLGASINEVRPSMAVLPGGQPVVAFHNYLGFNEGVSIYAVAHHPTHGVYGSQMLRRFSSQTGAARDVVLASDPVGLAAVWSEKGSNGAYNLRYGKLSSNLALTMSIPLRDAAGIASHPSIVEAGGSHLVSWEDRRGGGQQIFTAAVIGGIKQNELSHTDAAYTQGATLPQMSWDGSIVPIVFSQKRDLNPEAQIFLSLTNNLGDDEGTGDFQLTQTFDSRAVQPKVEHLTGSEHAVLWIDQKLGATADLMYATVSCD
jgi:hypothetical protein